MLIHGDNRGSLDLARNPVCHQRSKHIDVKCHFIREKFTNGEIALQHVPTADNIADLMTKAATKQKLEKFHGTFSETNFVHASCSREEIVVMDSVGLLRNIQWAHLWFHHV